ncbi:TRAP transporter substrate-binding protein DctP [Aquamicrobium sp. LC103]|uniref:TRAP transporter substrate-binding protein n=1 Tax=Aquamicrobium sp. LC103 TaxID=1120658 RepID=UPI00063E8907|nr:TRAP transporter substrate-binding protein DctP [Aquamicrobium sp. LC103]
MTASSLKLRWCILGTGIAFALAAGAAAAQETISLRVADHYAPSSLTRQYTIQYFMDLVKERSSGRVEFQYFPAEQLGKARDMLALTQQGVVDIGLVAPSYVPEKMPLSAVAELPGTYASSCEGGKAYTKIAAEGPLAERDFMENGIRPLIVFMLPPYQIVTRDPVTSLDDFSGLKLRSGGTAQDQTITALNAVPVRMSGVEVYESLSRGTLDGAVFPLQATIDFRLSEVLKNTTRSANFGGFATTYSISERAWNGIPDDLKTVIAEAASETERHACESLDRDDKGPALERLAEAGVQATEMPKALASEVAVRLKDIGTRWAASVDAQGLAGTQVLESFHEALGMGN